MMNHTPWKEHIIQLAFGGFMSSLRVQGLMKSWQAHECDQQFGENDRPDIGKCQRMWKEGNARINKVSAMRPGFAKIIEKVCISRHFQRPETDLHTVKNGCWIKYSDTWSSKLVHWLSQSQSTNHASTDYGCHNPVEFNTGVALRSLPVMRIHLWLTQEFQKQWFPETLLNTGWMDHLQVWLCSVKVILILDPVDVEKVYGNS